MDAPETRHAKASDGAFIAFQVIGAGSDLLYIPGSWSSTALSWEQPLDAAFMRALAGFARLIIMDRRGTGGSDPWLQSAGPPLEVQVGDMVAVLDAVGAQSATILGVFESTPLCAVFAATHPERTASLILYAPYARGAWAPDYPWAWTDDEFATDIASIEAGVTAGWGDSGYLDAWLREGVPGMADDPAARPWLVKNFQLTHGPGAAIDLMRMEHETDVRAVLPAIGAPTHVLHRTGDQMADLEEGRWLAGQIPGASFVELPGNDHPPWAGDQRSVIAAISGLLGVHYEPAPTDRVLATVLFTDIVGSTAQLAARGDAKWKELLEVHDEIARGEIVRHRGRYVASTGDGLLATLDGPASAIRCARAIVAGVRPLGIEIRAGVHTGEVELADDDVRGIAVHIGARVASLADASEVLVSQVVKDLTAGSGLVFEDAGEHELKGVPDRWHLYRVID